jgi:hypothetical protein
MPDSVHVVVIVVGRVDQAETVIAGGGGASMAGHVGVAVFPCRSRATL